MREDGWFELRRLNWSKIIVVLPNIRAIVIVRQSKSGYRGTCRILYGK